MRARRKRYAAYGESARATRSRRERRHVLLRAMQARRADAPRVTVFCASCRAATLVTADYAAMMRYAYAMLYYATQHYAPRASAATLYTYVDAARLFSRRDAAHYYAGYDVYAMPIFAAYRPRHFSAARMCRCHFY